MDDHIAKAEKLRKKANKLSVWMFDSKHKRLLNKAANYKDAKSWEKARAKYIKLGIHLWKTKSKHEDAATAFVEAARCYDITSVNEAIDCLKQGADFLCTIGGLNPATTCYEKATQLYKEIAELYESKENIKEAATYYRKASELALLVLPHDSEENIEKAMHFLEKAAELFLLQGKQPFAADQCYQKAAQLAAQIKQYPKARDIFEKIGFRSLSHGLLREDAKTHFFNAGICRLCEGDDVVALDISIMRYVEMYPDFPETWECRFLTYIKAPLVERDAVKFRDAVKWLPQLDSWTTDLLSRVEERLKASVKTRSSMNKFEDLAPANFTATFSYGGKEREMCTGLQRSHTTVRLRSPPAGSKLLWRSSSRIERSVDFPSIKNDNIKTGPKNSILQKGLTTFKRSLSIAIR